MVRVGLERVEALELLLGMVIAHLNHAEASGLGRKTVTAIVGADPLRARRPVGGSM